MNATQCGYYINLLAHAWLGDRPGYIPNDPDLIWKLARAESRDEFERQSDLVLGQFPVARSGKARYNRRLVQEMDKYKRLSASRASSGSAGASARWKSKLHGNPNDLPMAKNGSSTAIASSSSIATKTKTSRAIARIPLSPYLIEKIMRRDGDVCLVCGTIENLTIDHIVPVSRGGGNEEDNLQTLCRGCNAAKRQHSSVIVDGLLYLVGSNGRHSQPLCELLKIRRIETAKTISGFREERRRKEDEVRKELKVGAGPSSIYESIRLIGKAKTL